MSITVKVTRQSAGEESGSQAPFAEEVLDKCVKGQPPFCYPPCPFDFDIRSFAEKIQRKNIDSAFKLFRNAVVFPEIVSRLCPRYCENGCIRKETDQAIALNMLERACVDLARSKQPANFAVPVKQQKIAVIGAGISGLTFALRMAAKKYQVTVYDAHERVGGTLADLLPEDVYLADINLQFAHEKYTFRNNCAIDDLDALDADGIYIATGRGGDDFGLLVTMDQQTLATARPGVFLGGELIGSDKMHAIENALRAVNYMEVYLQSGEMNFSLSLTGEKSPTRLRRDTSRITPAPAVIPADGAAYSRDEAAAESSRCLLCDCNDCVERCELMKFYRKAPIKLASDVKVAFQDFNWVPHTSNRMVNSCLDCGACGDACHFDVDCGQMFMEARKKMLAQNLMTPAYHDYFLRDMEFAMREAHLLKTALEAEDARYVYFPGCQLGASDPRYVTESYRLLREAEPATALWLSCCSVPALWAGAAERHRQALTTLRQEWQALGRPTAIFACPTCQKTFARFLPEITGISLYQYLAEKVEPRRDKQSGQPCSIFDPCASRYDPAMQDAVRRLVVACGYAHEELPRQGAEAQCCSHGGHIAGANRTLARQIVAERVVAGEKPYVAYCANCRDIFAAAGKPTAHLLDLLCGINGFDREPPSISARRENRLRLKQKLLADLWGEEFTIPQCEDVIFSDQVLGKLAEERILKEDVIAAIHFCVKENRLFKKPAQDMYIAHAVIGALTYWVEFREKNGLYIVENAYSHRLRAEEEING